MDPKVAHPEARRTDAPHPKRETVQLQRGDSSQQLRQKLDAMVRDHAYRLYQSGGETHGKDSDHWAEAQAKLLSQNVEVRESGHWFHCNCAVQGTPAANILVAIDSQQLLIHLDREVSPEALLQDGAPVFYSAKWPQEVDPSTAAAYVVDSNLTIEVKKAEPASLNSQGEAANKATA
jgi:HSP20 family molecular chaperone IbpA